MFPVINLYFITSILMYVWLMKSRAKWAGHVVRMVQKSNAHRIFVERLEINMPLCRNKWTDNIKMNLKNRI
jgi:hypothetical protein